MGWQKGLVLVGAVAALAMAAATSALVLGLRPVPGSSGTTRLQVSPAAAVVPDRDTLTVVGVGSGTTAPDQARIDLGVHPTRPNVHDALAVASSETSQLLAALHGQGVEDKDIQTTGLGVDSVLNCCPQTVTGYQANSQVSVLVHHLANVGSVIAAAVDAVGNDLQVSGVSLSVADQSAAVKSARQAAMSDAAGRAKEWASLAGRHLGKMLAVSELINSAPALGCGKGCGGAGGLLISPGTSSVDLTVTVVYELLD
jgi:uncharacterized protein